MPPPGTVSGRQRAPGPRGEVPQLRIRILPASPYWRAGFAGIAWFGLRRQLGGKEL